jgi:preprotein translocase subunit SecE
MSVRQIGSNDGVAQALGMDWARHFEAMNANTPGPAKFNPGEFIREVRQEAAKVTWPSRKETMITTAMVILMSVLAAIFFMLVDWFLSFGVRTIFGLGA